MNSYFNSNRFSGLLHKNLAENYSKYLLTLGFIFGFMALACFAFPIFSFRAEFFIQGQIALIVIGLFLGGSIFTSSIFSDYGEYKKAINNLTQPCSILEKFMVAWLLSTLSYEFCFLTLFYFLVFFKILIYKELGLTYFNFLSHQGGVFLLVHLFLQSIFLFGSIYFKKLPFLKTCMVLFGFYAIIWFMDSFLLKTFVVGHLKDSSPFGDLEVENGKEYLCTALKNKFIVFPGLVMVLTLIFWTATYYKLKEKEV